MNCRDDDNVPVDWWILYKPPGGILPWEVGLNFSYISSTEAGKWIPSDRRITRDSRLQHTLAPMFRRTYKDHLAVLTYVPKEASKRSAGSSVMGLMLADELSGIWVMHTVPGLADGSDDRMNFPEGELKNGHTIVCLSANYVMLNELSKWLRQLEPQVVKFHMPESVKEWVPDWLLVSEPIRLPLNIELPHKSFEYVTKAKTLRGEAVIRRPGNSKCLYETFGKSHNIVLDVYGHHIEKPSTCTKEYSVRKIEAISLNYPNYINDDFKRTQVLYVSNQTDRTEFAVSTAAHWQYRGSSPRPEYWACIGSTVRDDSSEKGALLLCIEDYAVWRSFDILKIKEPVC